mmetsp:Transcript_49019/g.76465  ORF Transcript_49019/g.76465 Transcript_49019/m.76465 type:complete len:440 (-) Transcript_49019:172-1491(-)
MFPFSWHHTFIPLLPVSQLSEMDSAYPFIIGTTRDALPRGRVPQNVAILDTNHSSLSLPPDLSAVETSDASQPLQVMLDARLQDFQGQVERVLTRDSDPPGYKKSRAELWKQRVHAPGSLTNPTSGTITSMHGAVEALRNGIVSDFADLLFLFPLYVHDYPGAHKSAGRFVSSLETRAGSRKEGMNGGMVQSARHRTALSLELRGFVRSSEYMELMNRLARTQMFAQMVSARIGQSLPSLSHEFVSGVHPERDIFDNHIQRKLELEAEAAVKRTKGDVCGFLFIKETVSNGRAKAPSTKWVLKWCELSGLEFKKYLFHNPAGPAAVDGIGDTDDSVTLVAPRQTVVKPLISNRRDPTAFSFEVVVGGRLMGGGNVLQEEDDEKVTEAVVHACAKDEASRIKWMQSLRTRAMGPAALKRLAELGGVPLATPTASPDGPLR